MLSIIPALRERSCEICKKIEHNAAIYNEGMTRRSKTTINKLRWWGKIGLVVIGILSFSLSIFLTRPSNATIGNYQRLIDEGIVDAVATPHELGLDYLEQEAIELSADPGPMDRILRATEELAQMPENIPLAFPLGTNPIAIGRMPNDAGSPQHVSKTECIGYVDRQGQAKSFTPADGIIMLQTKYRNNGNLVMTPDAQHILLADASGSFLQARRIPVFNLIVRNRRTGQRFLVPRVNANSVCRDLIHAVLTGSIRRLSTQDRRQSDDPTTLED